MLRLLLVVVLLSALEAGAYAEATVKRAGNAFIVAGSNYTVEFGAENGAILAVRQTGRSGYLFKSGEAGLWRVRFRDGKSLTAAEFHAGSADHSFQARTDEPAHALRMEYRSAELTVSVTVKGREDGVDWVGEIKPASQVALGFELPARLRFDAAQTERFVFPADGNQSVGMAFKNKFFLPQPEDRPSAWHQEPIGAQNYAALYGGPLDQRADQEPAAALKVTPEGERWLGAGLVSRLQNVEATVNRPPTRAQAELILIDSANGPWLSANRLGGTGAIWRIGGSVAAAETGIAADSVTAVIENLAKAPAARKKIGILAMRKGPDQGGWAAVPIRTWIERLRKVPGAEVVEIATPKAMADALQSGDFLAILNPYGEAVPTVAAGMPATVDAIRAYVRAGGNWFETGGYPFFYTLKPVRFFSFGGNYPDLFADFVHLDSQTGSGSLYRVQPRTAAPWAAANDKQAIFIPGSLNCGGDAEGGWCERAYGTYVSPGETWRSPIARLTIGKTAPADLVTYCTDNAIRRRLQDKMDARTLEKFKRSILIYYSGSAKEKTEFLDRLPTPSLVHFADYLQGGFDKQYPDHLPPIASFGTPEEMRAFFDRAHELGHLVMPYTNPTWWCDHPKGPTFEAAGEAPLLKGLNGKPVYERYSLNDGWTITHWHPAVQAANRKTVRQFAQAYPVDMLFQDQCGARGWSYDLNPASPTPYAYSEGLISMVEEDCETKPLSTESGWDRVVNSESQLCGMTWQLVPTEYGPEWRTYLKQAYPPETWDIYPLAQYIAHDKTEMIHHDLGQFVTNQEVLSWTLGLGFGLSDRIGATELKEDRSRQWLLWLDRLQKSVCAQYVGEPVRAFSHVRGPNPTVADDGVIRADYGPVAVTANLGPNEKKQDDLLLPAHGFYAKAPGVTAGLVRQVGSADFGSEPVSFVAQDNGPKTDVWVYGPAEQEAAVQLPSGKSGAVSLAFDGGASVRGEAKDGILRFRLPAHTGEVRIAPPAALAGKAPRDWPNAHPAIGVLAFPSNPGQSWTRIAPAEWLRAFRESRLSRERGVPVRAITTLEDLNAALDAGPTAYLAIVNPYGEGIPEEAPGQHRAMLARIRKYVENGGNWWETAGYTFHQAFATTSSGWQTESVGPAGIGEFGIPIGGGEVEASPVPITVTPVGREWFGDALSNQIEKTHSIVNRGLPGGVNAPAHLTLVAGDGTDYIGGYRLNGWGWLWRIGGFWPEPQVALPVAVAAMDYVYTHAPLPAQSTGTRWLWHATLKK